MTIHVHHGSRLEELGDEVADLLAPAARSLEDVLQPEVIAVPTAGVRDFLVRHLARRLGVIANVELPFPGRFVERALALPAGGVDPWRVERLTFAVLTALERGGVDVPGWPAAQHPRRSRRYAVARRIADLFDRYATNRPTLLRQWQQGHMGDGTEGGRLPAEHHWQYHLWREVRATLGVPSPAERLPGLVTAMRRGVLDSELPPRVGWFGLNSMPAAWVDVLEALGERHDVHLYVVRPSPVQWAGSPGRPVRRLVRRRRPDHGGAETGNPLLRSWGRPALELCSLLNGLGEAPAGDGPSAADLDLQRLGAAPAATLLQHVQHDILADRAATAFERRLGDRSIEVHACHGVTRQLEVLRDVLARAFVDDPTLQPHEVLVLCPELERFEPFAAAVFGRGDLPVPLVVTDLTLGSDNPVAEALTTVLRVVGGRCTALDLVGVAGLEPVRQRLGLSTDDLDRIGWWVEELGASWGADAEHRAEVLGAAASRDVLVDGTWTAAVQSLLLGAAMPAPVPRTARSAATGEQVCPYDDMSGDAVVTAGRLAELVARLRRVRELMSTQRTAAAWCDVLTEVLSLLCATAVADSHRMAAVITAIDEFRSDAAAPTAPVELGAADAMEIAETIATAPRGRLRLRTGFVTMTGLAPVRNVPAKVVCILGFDEPSLRTGGLDGDDLLALRPCVGEPDPRDERRQFLLDAVLAARQRLVVTCDGNDLTTNRRVRFAVQLTELLEAVDATMTPELVDAAIRDLDSPVVTRHPRRAYDESNFGDPDPFGFDAGMRRAAEARRRAEHASARSPAARWALAVPSSTPPVTLEQLTVACTRPARALLRDRLDVRLPTEVAELDTNVPLAVPPAAAATIGRRLLARWCGAAATGSAHIGDDELERQVLEEWRRAEALIGRRPPGELVRQSLDDIARDVKHLIASAAGAVGTLDQRAILGACGSLRVDTPVVAGSSDGHIATTLRLVDTIGCIADAGRAGTAICRLSYTRPKARTYVEAALQLAAAVVSSGRTDWFAVTATRGSSRGARPVCQVLGVAGRRAEAQALLDAAATIRWQALSGAIPLFEEASRQLHVRGYLDEELLVGTEFTRGDLGDPDAAFVWAGATTADILRMGPKVLADQLWGAIDALVFEWAAPAGRRESRRPEGSSA